VHSGAGSHIPQEIFESNLSVRKYAASIDKVLLVVSSVKVAGEVTAVGKKLLVVNTVEFAAEVVPAGDAEAAPAH